MIEGDRLLPGVIVGGRYRILKFIGQGGFGITYAVHDTENGMTYAMKEYFPLDFADRRKDGVVVSKRGREADYNRYRNYFSDEGFHLSKFDHINIVPVIARFDAHGTSYLLMEFIDGPRLADHVNRHGPLESDVIMLVAENLIEALKAVHDQGLIHRDVKPGNILLPPVVAPRKTRLSNVSRDVLMRFGRPVLLDFGSARIDSVSGANHTCLVSFGYSAPEQFERGAPQTPQIDLYGLGATLYFCLGVVELPDAIQRAKGVEVVPAASRFASAAPARLLRAIDHAIEMDPAHRQQSIRQFRQEVFG